MSDTDRHLSGELPFLVPTSLSIGRRQWPNCAMCTKLCWRLSLRSWKVRWRKLLQRSTSLPRALRWYKRDCVHSAFVLVEILNRTHFSPSCVEIAQPQQSCVGMLLVLLGIVTCQATGNTVIAMCTSSVSNVAFLCSFSGEVEFFSVYFSGLTSRTTFAGSAFSLVQSVKLQFGNAVPCPVEPPMSTSC